MKSHLKENPKLSPQAAIRQIDTYFRNTCLPYIAAQSTKVTEKNYEELLLKVAKISTNGDEALSKSVIKAFNMVGDSGHITLAEESGAPGFDISKTSGYPVNKGYEESCGIFANEFINDQDNGRVYLEKPKFILVDGNVLDLAGLGKLFELIEQQHLSNHPDTSTNYVIFAHSFNKQVVAQLAQSFKKSLFKIVPCLTPVDALANSRYDFLLDIAAFSNGKIFNSLNTPLSQALPTDLGASADAFEMNRFRSVIHGNGQEKTLTKRLESLNVRKNSAATSAYERAILNERVGRLSGGIAKLTIRHVSDSQIREIKDRAEDAICAIRGAAKYGVVPGGCRMLLNLTLIAYQSESKLIRDVLGKSFSAPINVLLSNCGLNDSEKRNVLDTLVNDQNIVYDALNSQFGDAYDMGLLDSVPAVTEAMRSAIAIAGLLGTLGGIVVYARDSELERKLAMTNSELKREMEDYSPNTEIMAEDM